MVVIIVTMCQCSRVLLAHTDNDIEVRSVSVEVVDPGVSLGALLLAGGELPGVPLVAQVTPALLLATPAGPVGEVAVEDGGGVDLWEGFWVPSPGYQLLGGNKVNIGKSEDGVDKLEEPILTVLPVEEPGGVEEQGEGSLALCVVLQEVLGENLLDGVGIFCVETPISHGAGSASHILQSLHGYFPHTGVGLGGARLDAAAVGHAVLQGVGPGGGPCGHGGVVVKSVPAQHVEHLIPTNSEERSSHPLNISRVHPSVTYKELSLSNHLIGPLLLIEVCTEGVGDGVGSNLMPISVQVLDLSVVGPFM